MYVRAPYRSTVGTTLVPYVNWRQNPDGIASRRWPTIGQALANALDFNFSASSSPTFTTKTVMMDGCVGYKKYINTDYSVVYCQVGGSGHAVNIKQHNSNRQYYPEAASMGVNYTGAGRSGVTMRVVDDLNPSGSSLHWQALYNRAAIASVKNRAVVECKQKLADSKFDVSEFLVDIDRTVLLVAERVRQFVTAWRAVRRGDWLGAIAALGLSRRRLKRLKFRDAQNAWLEFQYGWRPILNDIFGGIALVNQGIRANETHIHAVRRIREDLTVSPATLSESQTQESWQDLNSTQSGTVSTEVKFRARISDATIAYLTSLELLNPLYTVWVATPFSFVIDWMIPVGDWLSSLSAPLGLKFVSGYQTTRVWGEITANATRKGISGVALYTLVQQTGGSSAYVRVAYMQRVAFHSWPISRLYFRFPFSSYERIASAIALTRPQRQIFR